jgi:putative CocE/NonD family hydrolase
LRHVLIRRGFRTLLGAMAVSLAFSAPAVAAPAPDGSKWSQQYIDEPDGTQLHADVLRPANLPDDAKTPVILSIGPYFNHSGQLGAAGGVEGEPYDPLTVDGPSSRFYDFINGSHLLQKGYTWVQVDLRGFGGSSGCLDWGGTGEQADVKAAIEWAASQKWSTGKVGTYGKSYDGATGLMSIALQPKGLAAVVAQEPLYDLYRYLYMNRVRFVNSVATPALYDAIAGTPGPAIGTGDPSAAPDFLAYNFNSLNDTAKPGCPAQNVAGQQDPDHDSDFWKLRDFIPRAKGQKTPLLLTQGLLEDNTKPDGFTEFFNGLAGPKRAWYGMWDHVRPNDRDADGRLLEGRDGWFDETMRFYDRHLKGAKVPDDPPIEVESNDGRWRAESAWPPADSLPHTSLLNPGSYSDDGTNNGTGDAGSPNGSGVWTFSPPFPYPVHMAGVPRIAADLGVAAPDANFVADVYDVDAKHNATLISRGTSLLPGAGKVAFDMYGDDWTMPAGHRIGVLLTGANAEWWAHVPTGQQVDVKSAQITLPFLGCRRSSGFIDGGPSVKLESYLKDAPFALDAETVNSQTAPGFALPADQGDCTKSEVASGGPAGHGCIDRRRFSFRLRHAKGQRVTSVKAYVNGRLVLRRRGHDIRRVSIRKLPLGKFKVKIVSRTSDRHLTRTVRTYKGCRKSRPHGTHAHP